MAPQDYALPALFLLGWISFWTFSFVAPRFQAPASTRQSGVPAVSARARRQFYAIFLFATLLHGAGFWNLTPLRYSGSLFPPASAGVALAIFCAGILLAMYASWSIRFLSFREMVFSMSPRRVGDGAYRLIRHPMYAGMTLAFFGFLLAYPTLLGAASLAAIVCIFSARARAESRAFASSGDMAH